MAKITISERDISYIPSNDVGNDVVYVPGYAVTGPVNTPVLCRTVSEFQNIFGKTPYIFTENELYNTIFDGLLEPALTDYNFCLKNEIEKSYIYAIELLNHGLPILFERIMKVNDNAYANYNLRATGTEITENSPILKITAKYPGNYGQSIAIELKSTELDKETINLYKYIYDLTININTSYTDSLDNNINFINNHHRETIKFSFDPNSEYYFKDIKNNYIDINLVDGIDLTKTMYDDIVLNNIDKINLSYINTVDFTLKYYYSKLLSLDEIENPYIKLKDKNEYQIKYITTGGYPNYFNTELASSQYKTINERMAEIAAKRGDCIALIDYALNDYHNSNNEMESLYISVNGNFKNDIEIQSNNGNFESIYKYATMFAPYGKYKSTIFNTISILPGSFAYLSTLGESLKNNPSWYAVAGVTRGLVPNLIETIPNITGAVADLFQQYNDYNNFYGVTINPIINIKPYGYTIWGNRTLYRIEEVLTASAYLNIRSLACDVKKLVYKTCKKYMFESLSDILWLNFKADIEPELDKMVSGNGLSDYQIIRKSTTEKATICAIIRLYAIEAVENFDISIELSDSFVNVE